MTLDISVMHALSVLVADAVAVASVLPVASSANADWYPATASPPAATVPPVTTRARRRVIVLLVWFPVMAAKVGTQSVRGWGVAVSGLRVLRRLKPPGTGPSPLNRRDPTGR